MVHALVQKIAVMGDQDKPALGVQVLSHQLSGCHVQMISGLINEQKLVFSQKENRQQHLGLFSLT